MQSHQVAHLSRRSSGVESSITRLSDESAECVRNEIVSILRKTKPPEKNITREELLALKELRENEDIIVLPADKGNASVVLDTTEYKRKMGDLLKDPAYKCTENDPTVYLEKKTRTLILNSPIDNATAKFLIPREKSSRIPKLYGLPKIHKPGAPLRPIVSAVNSPTQALSRHLAKIMQPLTEDADSYVKNSTHFVEFILKK